MANFFLTCFGRHLRVVALLLRWSKMGPPKKGTICPPPHSGMQIPRKIHGSSSIVGGKVSLCLTSPSKFQASLPPPNVHGYWGEEGEWGGMQQNGSGHA